MKLRTILSEMLSDGVVYHGTNSSFDTFNDSKPIFFTDNPDVAKSYGDRIIKAKLTLENPIEIDFEGKSTGYFSGKWYVPSDLADRIKLIADDMNKYGRVDDDLIDDMEIDHGWSDNYGDLDGIVMKNIKDSYGDVFAGDIVANNYVVFNKNQIKIVK